MNKAELTRNRTSKDPGPRIPSRSAPVPYSSPGLSTSAV